MDTTFLAIFQIAVLIFSAVVHEVSHGYAALSMGDQTAKFFGRLTLNPLKHIDLFGSILMPLFLYFATNGTFLFAYAKPVPINPDNLRDRKYGTLKVALAGPASNICVAVLIGIAVRAGGYFIPNFSGMSIWELLMYVVFINVLLAVFNLVPIPPLDGSRVLSTFLPYKYRNVEIFLERWGMIILFAMLFFGGFRFIYPVITLLVRLFTGFGF